jgi:hypothetical protein
MARLWTLGAMYWAAVAGNCLESLDDLEAAASAVDEAEEENAFDIERKLSDWLTRSGSRRSSPAAKRSSIERFKAKVMAKYRDFPIFDGNVTGKVLACVLDAAVGHGSEPNIKGLQKVASEVGPVLAKHLFHTWRSLKRSSAFPAAA